MDQFLSQRIEDFSRDRETNFACDNSTYVNDTDTACDVQLTDKTRKSAFLYCSKELSWKYEKFFFSKGVFITWKKGRAPKYIWIPIGMYFDLHHKLEIHQDAGIDVRLVFTRNWFFREIFP